MRAVGFDLLGLLRIFFFFFPYQQPSAGMPARGCEERDSCRFPPEMRRKTAGKDCSLQSAFPLRLRWSLLMNLAIIKGEESAEREILNERRGGEIWGWVANIWS